MRVRSLLTVANAIGVLRLALLAAAASVLATSPRHYAALFLLSALLDLVDGWAARALGQATEFGAAFDQLIDITSWTVAYVAVPVSLSYRYSPSLYVPVAVLVAAQLAVEWSVALLVLHRVTRGAGDLHWKSLLCDSDGTASWTRGLVAMYFANGQKNLLSLIGNVGHVALPLLIVLYDSLPDTLVRSLAFPTAAIAILAAGMGSFLYVWVAALMLPVLWEASPPLPVP